MKGTNRNSTPDHNTEILVSNLTQLAEPFFPMGQQLQEWRLRVLPAFPPSGLISIGSEEENQSVTGRDRKPRKILDRHSAQWKGRSSVLKHTTSYFELLSGNGIQQRKDAARMRLVA